MPHYIHNNAAVMSKAEEAGKQSVRKICDQFPFPKTVGDLLKILEVCHMQGVRDGAQSAADYFDARQPEVAKGTEPEVVAGPPPATMNERFYERGKQMAEQRNNAAIAAVTGK